MSYIPTRSDATAVAADAAARLTTSGVAVSVNDRLVAIADNMLCAAGLQAFDEQVCSGADSRNVTSFAAIATMPTYTFVSPIARTYLVHLDLVGVFQSSGLSGVQFRLFNATTNVASPSVSWQWYPTAINTRSSRASFRVPMVMQSGNNVIRVDWHPLVAAEVANVDAAVARVITVTG